MGMTGPYIPSEDDGPQMPNCQAGHTGVVVLEMKIQLHENATTDTIFLKPDSIQIAAIS